MDGLLNSLWSIMPAPMRDQIVGYGVAFWRVLPQIVMVLVFLIFVWPVVKVVQKIVPGALGQTYVRRSLRDVVVMLSLPWDSGLWAR